VPAQALIALDECVCAILVVDGRVGITTLDEEIARFLRRQKKPVYVAVNKCENQGMAELWASPFWKLGLGNPYPVSGLHGIGVAEVLEGMLPHIYDVENAEDDPAINVAIVGRPNVGKSSLLNRLYGKERAIVSDVSLLGPAEGPHASAWITCLDCQSCDARALSDTSSPSSFPGHRAISCLHPPTPLSFAPVPLTTPLSRCDQVAGTTRDAVDALVTHEDQEYRFIDTAGIRKKKKVEYGNEFLMVNRALKAIRRAEVVLLVLDVVAGITDQDKQLAQRIAEDGRCVTKRGPRTG
jgi:predicted GTPase